MILKNKIFIFSALLFGMNQLLEKKFGIFIPLLHAYLDDLLCMPIVLTLTLLVLQFLLKDFQFRLNKFQIFIAFVYFSIMFEIILPSFSAKYTPDILDIAAYGAGAFIFFNYINVPPLNLKSR